MRKIFILLCSFLTVNVLAQQPDTAKAKPTWVHNLVGGLNLTQVSFNDNWAQGGETALAYAFSLIGKLANELAQNYPNPFSPPERGFAGNPETVIRFTVPARLAAGTRVQVRVYNTLGEVVQTLVDQAMLPGQHTARWNGRNDEGRLVAAGIYFTASSPAISARRDVCCS